MRTPIFCNNALAQFGDLSDGDLNRPLELPECNTAFALATHLIGAAEYWVLQLAGGRDVQRDRLSEFHAAGTRAELVARYERWLVAMQELLQPFPDERLNRPVNVPASHHSTFDEASRCSLARCRTWGTAPGPPGVDPATPWV